MNSPTDYAVTKSHFSQFAALYAVFAAGDAGPNIEQVGASFFKFLDTMQANAAAALAALPPRPVQARRPRAAAGTEKVEVGLNDGEAVVMALKGLGGEHTIGEIAVHFATWPQPRLVLAIRQGVVTGRVGVSGQKRGTRYRWLTDTASDPLDGVSPEGEQDTDTDAPAA